MAEIEICNLRYKHTIYPFDFRVDRSNVLGNPFYLHTEKGRNIVCDKYKIWLNQKLNKDQKIIAEFDKIYQTYLHYGKLRLFCWCAPLRCHSEEIAAKILQRRSNG